MDEFPITVKVKDVSGSIFWSITLADFEDEDTGITGTISNSGDNILFSINDKQYAVSITKILSAIYNHTKK